MLPGSRLDCSASRAQLAGVNEKSVYANKLSQESGPYTDFYGVS